MRNNKPPKIRTIISLVKELPYFSFDNLVNLERDRIYLKIIFSRYRKSGKILRLKKGIYVTKEYIDKTEKGNQFSAYLEFVAGIIYSPAYLSLDYVLYKHNLLTEIPRNFTAVTANKTAVFSNDLGNFFYHKIKDDLFRGFEPVKKEGYLIFEATKAKALFDYLYLRKNDIINRSSAEALRLNLEEFGKSDKKEFRGYVKREGSRRMKDIADYLLLKCNSKK